jgi:flagellar hook-associated protein FlgK
MTMAQHAYNAAARVSTTIDEMLDTLINRTAV